MKKILSIFITALCSLCLFACVTDLSTSNNENNNNNSEENNNNNEQEKPAAKVKLSKDMFNDCKININNLKSIGIINEKPDYSTNNENILIGFDQDDKRIEITFTNVDGKIVAQSNIEAFIDKIYVTTDFLYFKMTKTSKTSEDRGEDYDAIDYTCDPNSQSFVVYRETNKVYSLSDFPNIYLINNNVLKVNTSKDHVARYTYYKISVENDNLIAKDLVPNKNISLRAVFVDKNGFIYVINNAVDLVSDNVVYLNSSFDVSYALGDDGLFYRALTKYSPYSNGDTIQLYNSLTHSWTAPSTSGFIRLDFNSSFTLIKNSVFSIDSPSSYYAACEYTLTNDNLLINSDRTVFTDGYCYMAKYDIYLHLGKNLYVMNTTDFQKREEFTLVLENVTSVKSYDDYLIATREELEGTKKYLVTGDGYNAPTYEFFSETTYESNVLVIKPLN